MPYAQKKTFAAALLAALVLAGCGGEQEQHQMPPPDVSAAAVVQKQVNDWDEYVGRIEAIESVELRPRVAGYLAGVHFKEGSVVQKGDLLFTIDDREYKAAVAAARADVTRAAARIDMAKTEFERSKKLIEARAVSQGELDSREMEMSQARADQQGAMARLQQAELNLDFTRIEAPITGRIGAAMVKPGNLVAPGTTLLATLMSIDPVHVVFEGDERAYLRYQQMARDGDRESSRDAANPVEVALANETEFKHRGSMDFVDNAMNPQTGTIRGRAILPNPDGAFTPGLFARVRLLGAAPREALLIHDQAVLTDQDRKYVYVVGPNNAAMRKDIVLGESIDGLRVVESGLAAGDRVIVNGVRKIFFPGQPVAPRDVPMDAPSTPPPAAPEATAQAGGAAQPEG